MPTPPVVVEVRYAPVEAIDDARRARLLVTLSPDERARHARFRFVRDRDGYLVAHALLRAELARHAGVAPEALRFDASPSGKPLLAWPTTSPPLAFSLTHARGLVACAVTRGVDVGIDVESLDRSTDLDALEARALSPHERAALAGLDADARRLRFFEIWALKEAYAKATGIGLGRTLGTVEMAFEPTGVAIRFLAGQAEDPAAWSFDLHTLPSRHVLAVATRAVRSRVVLTQASLTLS